MESYILKDYEVKPKHSSEEALQKWRKLCGFVKNPKRRFRFTANLSKRCEAQAMRRTNQLGVFSLSQPNSKEANILFLGQNMDCKKAVISNLSDEVSSEYSTSWEFSNGEIKFKFFDLGEHRIAHRAWSDHNATMDAAVYIVDADPLTQEELLGPGEELNALLWDHFRGPREELNALLSDEVFGRVPFVIFGVTSTGACSQLKERLCDFLSLPYVTIELTSTGTRFQLRERLRYSLRLPNVTIEPADTNARPLEIFVAQTLHKEEYLDGFQWLSQYIK